MKKIIGIMLVLVFGITALIPSGASAQLSGTTANWCSNFAEGLYFNREGSVRSLYAWADSYRRNEEKAIYGTLISKIDSETRALHKALELEGFVIPNDEKKDGSFGAGTASAVVQLQNKYSSQILTGTGYSTGNGIVNEKTRAFLNQKYGCIEKAVIDLTDPNGTTVRARGELLAIKWNATKIPNEATLTISYVKSDNTGSTTIATQTIKNGKGSYNWTIPNTLAAGSYKVQLALTGVVKSDISAKPFEIRETALELLTQNTAETYNANQKVDIKWKTSTAIAAAASLKLQMVSVPPAGSNAMPAIYDIATVKNTGTYAWTVPEKVGNTIVANGGQYKLLISTTNGSAISDYSNANFTLTNFVRQVSITGPAAGSSLAQGDTLTLQWNQSNLTGTAKITAKEKVTSGTAAVVDFGTAAVTAGSKALSIPLTFKPATYVFTIENTTAGINASSSREFVVTQKGRSLTVLGPNGGERVGTSTTFDITWNATGIDSTVKSLKVNLIDTVANRTALVKDTTPNDRKVTFTLPVNGVLGNIVGLGTYADARYKIEVQAIGTTGVLFSDQSNSAFVINRNSRQVEITKPAAGNKVEVGSVLRVEWTYSNITTSESRPANVELINASGSTIQVLSNTVKLAAKAAQATLAPGITAGNYKVRVTAFLLDGTQVQDESDTFEIANKVPSVTVTAPNTASEFKMKDPLSVKWTVANLPANANSFEVRLTDTVLNKTERITTATRSALSASWVPPVTGVLGQITGIGSTNVKKYKVVVNMLDVNGATIATDQSDTLFAITSSNTDFTRTVSITSPANNTTVEQGGSLTVNWTSLGLTGNVAIAAKEKVATSPVTQDFGTAAVTAGSKALSIPLTLKPATYTLTLSNTTSGVTATSSVDIVVASKNRSITVTAPNGGERVGTSPSFDITWSAVGTDTTVKSVRVNLMDVTGNKKVLLKDVTPSTTKLTYTIPVNGVQNDIVGLGTYADARYKIEVQAIGTGGVVLYSDQSNANFIINRNSPTLQVTKPASGTKVEIGSVVKPEWTYTNVIDANRQVTVELINSTGGVSQTFSTGATKLSVKSAQATLSALVAAGNYKFRVSSTLADGTQLTAESATFEITNKIPLVTVTAPNTAVDIKFATGVSVAWTVKNLPANANAYEIYLVDTQANKTQRITSVGKTASSYKWSVPANGILGTGTDQITGIGDGNTKKYKVEVRMIDVSGVQIVKDQSDNNFAIVR